MIKINLLADRQAKDRLIIQQQLVLGVIGIAATFVLCVFWLQLKSGQITDTNEKIAKAKIELKKQEKIRKQVSDMEKREKQVTAMLAAIANLMKVKQGPTIYFDNLNVILPPEIWMTTLTHNRGAVLIQGYSFSNNAIAQLMKNMEKSDYFTGVNLRTINKTKFGNETLKKFTINTTTQRKTPKKDKKGEEAGKMPPKKG